jgi:hypothetical protein
MYVLLLLLSIVCARGFACSHLAHALLADGLQCTDAGKLGSSCAGVVLVPVFTEMCTCHSLIGPNAADASCFHSGAFTERQLTLQLHLTAAMPAVPCLQHVQQWLVCCPVLIWELQQPTRMGLNTGAQRHIAVCHQPYG